MSDPEWLLPALIEHVRTLGCKCEQPLIGYSPGYGPRCRLCNVDSETMRPEHLSQENFDDLHCKLETALARVSELDNKLAAINQTAMDWGCDDGDVAAFINLLALNLRGRDAKVQELERDEWKLVANAAEQAEMTYLKDLEEAKRERDTAIRACAMADGKIAELLDKRGELEREVARLKREAPSPGPDTHVYGCSRDGDIKTEPCAECDRALREIHPAMGDQHGEG